MTSADEFEPGHADRVTVLHFNFTSTRILTASADHRIKVWERDSDTGEQTLTDTWTAHDADIRDAKWLHPTTGSNIASIGNDLKFKLWTEDPSQPPNSGRRFRCISTIPSNTKVPFVSLDIKKLDSVYTYVALIDRLGLLSIYEPTSFDSFREWSFLDQWNVCSPNPPERGAETSFKVRFDQNAVSTPYMNSLTDDTHTLSLVATAMDTAKIYRSTTTQPYHPLSSTPGPLPLAGPKTSFYEAQRLPPHPALIRDVQWAPFNVRGYDLIATACCDGAVRIYRLDTTAAHSTKPGHSLLPSPTTPSQLPTQQLALTHPPSLSSTAIPPTPHRPAPQSSLTSAIAGRSTTNTNTTPTSNPTIPSPPLPPSSTNLTTTTTTTTTITTTATATTTPFPPLIDTITLESTLPHAHRDAWALAWDPAGQVLMSSGSDGVTKLWKRGVGAAAEMEGGRRSHASVVEAEEGRSNWLLFAEHEVGLVEGEEEEEEEEEVELEGG